MRRQEDTTYEIEVGETYRVAQLQDYFEESSLGSFDNKGSNSYYYFDTDTLLINLNQNDNVKVVDKVKVNSGYGEKHVGIKGATAYVYKLELDK